MCIGPHLHLAVVLALLFAQLLDALKQCQLQNFAVLTTTLELFPDRVWHPAFS